MDMKEKLARANKLYEEVKVIMANPDATAEDKAKIGSMMTEAEQLRAEVLQMQRVKDFGTKLATETQALEDKKEEMEQPGEFKSWAEFLEAAHLARHPHYRGEPDPRLVYFLDDDDKGTTTKERKQMVEAIGGLGGFLVPPDFRAQLQAAVAENAIVRPRATPIRMRSRTLQIPTLNQTATGVVGQPAWFGGLVAAWGAEALEKVMDVAEWMQVKLTCHELYLYTRASNQLIRDSAISLSDFLSGPMGMAGCISFMEDYAFLQGTGAGQPLGVITAVNTPTIVVARAVAGTIGYVDVVNIVSQFMPSGKGVWVISQSAMPAVLQMTGPAGNPSYVWAPNAQEKVPGYLFGYPVVWSEKVPRLGVQGDIGLYDFTYYIIGDREATTIESTEFDKWAFDQTSWRAVHRVDGQPWLSAPITYMDQVTQVSPFVILGGPVSS